MRDKIIAFAALALASVFISGCATSTNSPDTSTTNETKKDRTKSSMYAR